MSRQCGANSANRSIQALLDAFLDWAKTQRRRLSGKVPLGKAFQYALSRWDALTRYIDDGQLSIDNNLAERLLRGTAVSRKNFLFLGSDRGGQRAAAIYTITRKHTLPVSSIGRPGVTQSPGSMNSCPGTSNQLAWH
jgi:hypothetical protein